MTPSSRHEPSADPSMAELPERIRNNLLRQGMKDAAKVRRLYRQGRLHRLANIGPMSLHVIRRWLGEAQYREEIPAKRRPARRPFQYPLFGSAPRGRQAEHGDPDS